MQLTASYLLRVELIIVPVPVCCGQRWRSAPLRPLINPSRRVRNTNRASCVSRFNVIWLLNFRAGKAPSQFVLKHFYALMSRVLAPLAFVPWRLRRTNQLHYAHAGVEQVAHLVELLP